MTKTLPIDHYRWVSRKAARRLKFRKAVRRLPIEVVEAIMGDFTDAEKLRCVERELSFRRRVYARWVKDGRMTMIKAQTEIRLMNDIAADYRERIAREPSLFGNMAR